VAEYEKPDFGVTLSGPENAIVTQSETKIEVGAEYYTGIPLSLANGKYTLSSQPYSFDGGKTKGYIFGDERFSRFGFDMMDFGMEMRKETE